jgi:hypothetical protein
VVRARDADAVEIDRVVPASGNMSAAGRQIWLGKALAGQQVTIRLDHSTMHVFRDGQLIKTHPVTLDGKDLARPRTTGAKPARPSPATALPPGPLPADAVIEVQRLVGAGGCVGIGGKQVSAGIHLAGQRVTLRLDAKLLHVITAGGVLARTLPSPLTPTARSRLRGARLAGPPPPPPPALRVTRVVSSQGGLMVAGVKIHLGHVHRGKVVTVVIEGSQFRILHDGTQLAACPKHGHQGGHPPQRKRPPRHQTLGARHRSQAGCPPSGDARHSSANRSATVQSADRGRAAALAFCPITARGLRRPEGVAWLVRMCQGGRRG